MTKIIQKMKRPRINSSLILTYQDIKDISDKREILVSNNVAVDFSPATYFRIVEHQASDPHKNRDTDRMLRKATGHYARRINMLRLMRDVSKIAPLLQIPA